MRKTIIFILGLIFIGLIKTTFILSSTNELKNSQSPQKNIDSESIWKKIYFKKLNKYYLSSKLKNLNKIILPKGDFEIRIRIYPELLVYKELIIIKKTKNNITCHSLLFWNGKLDEDPKNKKFFNDKFKGYTKSKPYSYYRQKLESKNSLQDIIQKLIKNHILTLPDESQLPHDDGYVMDGISFIFETIYDNIYRTYHYSNPSHYKWNEAKRVLEIINILKEEFDLAYTTKLKMEL